MERWVQNRFVALLIDVPEEAPSSSRYRYGRLPIITTRFFEVLSIRRNQCRVERWTLSLFTSSLIRGI
jgi:hypothetical protein